MHKMEPSNVIKKPDERYVLKDLSKSAVFAIMISTPFQLKKIIGWPATVAVLFLIQVTGTIFRKHLCGPVKSWLNCFLDALFYIPCNLKLGIYRTPCDIDTAIKDAMAKTGLSDFDDDGSHSFANKYRLSRNIGMQQLHKAHHSPFGFIVEKIVLSKRMELRLQLVDYLKKHPSIKDVKFAKAPISVIGYPRTGTTYLHDLLGLDPKTRSHLVWEQLSPLPTTHDESPLAQRSNRQKRYNGRLNEYYFKKRLAGDYFQAVHRVEYDLSEECLTFCSMELPWNILDLHFTPCSAEKLFELGAGRSYEFYLRFLQVLTWQAPELPSTWMLKCPWHLAYLDDLHTTFSDSPFIWTHRNPLECISSSCSLFFAIASQVMDPWTIDKKVLGRNVAKYARLSFDRAFAAVKKHKDTLKIVHVKYTDTIKDPIKVCKEIYTAIELPFSSEYESLLKTYIAKSNKKREEQSKSGISGKVGKIHCYSLEEYGLNADEISSDYKSYIENYC
mmetsp:Transcript_22397/g.27365  ORF Transcript_22397/g.27365 Transcript_22397/m.27365 type:complete len:501 (-) Transcript_22397:104-1606(-)